MLRAALVVSTLLVVACAPKPQPRRYPFHGQVVSVDAANKTANIHNDNVPGWMEAMTMEYPLPESPKLKAGDSITATVVVTELNYHLENIKIP